MKKLLLIGNGEAHAEVLRQLAKSPAANADITLATANDITIRAAMVPGHVAGHLALERCRIDLAPLAGKAGVSMVRDRVIVFDPQARVAVTAGGRELEFDFASLDPGVTSLDPDIPGLGKFALLAHPSEVFLEGWARVRELAAEGALSRLTVVGGGVEGVELMLAMHHNLRRSLPADVFAACGFCIVTAAERLLAALPEAIGKAAEATCLARGISLLKGAAVVEVERAALHLANGARLASDITVWAAGVRGPRWLESAGLGCDSRARVPVDVHLRALENKRVYAAGRCAIRDPAGGGQFAGPDGARLATGLRQALAGEPPLPVVAAPPAPCFVTLGTRQALAVRGSRPLNMPAWLLWRYKAWTDRAYMRRFAASGQGSPAPARPAQVPVPKRSAQ